MRLICLGVALAALSGCKIVGPVYYTPTLQRGSGNEAVVDLGEKIGDVLVRSLDGQVLASEYTTWNGGWSAVRELHVTPGTHTLQGYVAKGGLERAFELTETFEAGAHYKLSPTLVGYGLGYELVRVDTKGGQP
ncbi:hypothetical protein [Lysobacter terrae]